MDKTITSEVTEVQNEGKQKEVSLTTRTVESKPVKRSNTRRILLPVLSVLSLMVISVGATLAIIAQDDIKRVACEKNILTSVFNCEVKVENSTNNQYQVNTVTNPIENPVLGNSFDVSDIYKKAYPSVVGIGIQRETTDDEQIIGSGFIISSDGLIATNQHVVSEENSTYFVKLADVDDVVTVQEIFRDAVNDIAILKINQKNLPALALGNSDNLIPGELVVAIGNPLGQFSSTITSGIISGLNRTVEIGNQNSFLRTSSERFEDTIQTDAAINPGNSGGPLLNKRGEVIGINFATLIGADNLSFAIPVSYLKNRVEELNEFGRFRISYVGISYSMGQYILDDELVIGARVQQIDLQGTAGSVLEIGDVIIEFDGKKLDDESLSRLIQTTEIGQRVPIQVVRDEKIEKLEIEIGERK